MTAPKSKKTKIVLWSILILASLILMNAVWHNQGKRNHQPGELRPDLPGAGEGAGKSDGKMSNPGQPGPEEMQSKKQSPAAQSFIE